MTLNNFIKKHHLRLNRKTILACNEAVEIMSKSMDNMHDFRHIESILDSLNKFINESVEIHWKKINFDILLLSICWHDVWKSKRIPTSRGKAVFHQLAEGIGSMRQYSRLTKKYRLDSSVSKKVRYAIRKHSMFQILPTLKSNVEARILQDLDKLDTWKPARIKLGLQSLQKSGPLSPGFINFFKLYFKLRMLPGSYKGNFGWTINEIQNHKNDFFVEMKNMIVDLSGPKAGNDSFLWSQKKHLSFLQRIRSTISKIIP